jgi:hypothetical protein
MQHHGYMPSIRICIREQNGADIAEVLLADLLTWLDRPLRHCADDSSYFLIQPHYWRPVDLEENLCLAELKVMSQGP